jgi:CheY-like chemotaxis protein
VAFCNKGTEAVDLALITHPDIIICDIDMPDLPGGEVAAQWHSFKDMTPFV